MWVRQNQIEWIVWHLMETSRDVEASQVDLNEDRGLLRFIHRIAVSPSSSYVFLVTIRPKESRICQRLLDTLPNICYIIGLTVSQHESWMQNRNHQPKPGRKRISFPSAYKRSSR